MSQINSRQSESCLISLDVRLARGGFDLHAAFKSNSDALALFGPSGSGKSTVLALIAGLLKPESGHIRFAGRTLVDIERGIWLPAHKRRVGLVFQDALLFPHLSVQANLRYGRRAGGAVNLDELVDLLGIAPLLARRPSTLSGGERQRVAIARALLAEPALLLLDEPLASLDHARRAEIMPYLSRIREQLGIPMILVSHALEEVVRLADEVVLLRHGRVDEQGVPEQMLMPLGFNDDGLGVVSVIEAPISRYDERDAITELDHPAGRISLPGRIGEPGQTHRILVRATDVALAVSRPREISHRTLLQGRIANCHDTGGPLVRIDLRLRGRGRLAALITRRAMHELGIDVGDEVYALAKASAIDDRAFGEQANRFIRRSRS